jgi:glycosyltransferase involved in cell wall biosynthesis
MMKSQKLMEHAALDLPPAYSYPDGLPVYFLTGKKYLYQTLFCIRSLTKVSNEKFKFILVDDGSFDNQIINRIKKQLPKADIITKAIIDQNLQEYLPANSYPGLHHKRKIYPHIKKLTDIHTSQGSEWKLVLDSDMLFWHEPRAIINWLKNPGRPLHMIDCIETYGYSKPLMEDLCNTVVKPLINVGAIGLNSNSINWNELENWVKILEEKEGSSYYLEQALTAMLIGNKPSEALNSTEYTVNPTVDIIDNKSGSLHHYVDLSKEPYFKKAWKHL